MLAIGPWHARRCYPVFKLNYYLTFVFITKVKLVFITKGMRSCSGSLFLNISIQTTFRPSCMNRASVFEWHKRFNEGTESVRDDGKCVRSHHHHHVTLVARISLTLSRHSSLSFIAPGWSSGQHPVCSHSCWMYVRAGRPAFARPCVGVHKSTSLYSCSKFICRKSINLSAWRSTRRHFFVQLHVFRGWIWLSYRRNTGLSLCRACLGGPR